MVSDDILKTTLLKIRNNTPIIIYTYDSSNRIDFDINSITKNYLLVNYPLRLL
ncbi:MAG: hypothetical protein LBQ59_01175 [Candidatus Peribacteria bacterium]|nr:hypothetical protein [Candidatus Peribacteria bacterium]